MAAAVLEAAAARRPAAQEAGKRQALTVNEPIDLTLDDDPPIRVEEQEGAAVAPTGTKPLVFTGVGVTVILHKVKDAGTLLYNIKEQRSQCKSLLLDRPGQVRFAL